MAKLRRATISYVMYGSPSARQHAITRLPLDGFSCNFISEYFLKICRENSSFIIKHYKNTGYFTWRPKHIFDHISPSVLLRMRNVSDKGRTENQNAHFVLSNIFFENRAVYAKVWQKYCRLGQATWQYGACALHAGYLRLQTHTALRLCNARVSTTTMSARTHSSVTSHVLYTDCLVL